MTKPQTRFGPAAALALLMLVAVAAPGSGQGTPDRDSILAEGETLEAECKYDLAIQLYRRAASLGMGGGASGRARLALGRVLLETEQFDEALGWLGLVVLQGGRDEAAPEARYLIGRAYALLGDPVQSMIEFQRLRDDYPGHLLSRRALEDISMLLRFAMEAKASPRRVFLFDKDFGIETPFEEPVDLGMDSRGDLYIADRETSQLHRVGPEGRIAESFRHGAIGRLHVDRRDRVYQVVGGNLWIKDGPHQSIKRFTLGGAEQDVGILDLCISRDGEFYILDEDSRSVMKFDKNGTFLSFFPDREVDGVGRIAIDGFDNLYLLMRNDRVEIYGPTGRQVRSLGPEGEGFEWKGPIDIALDAHDRLYVLDKKARHGDVKACSVSVFDRTARLLAWIISPVDSPGEFRSPAALTLDRSGRVYILDDKTNKVLRFH